MNKKINQGTIRMNEGHTPVAAPPRIVHRLSPDQYRELERNVGPLDPRVTDPVQAAFQLGVQHVLRVVRNGFVAG